MEETNKRMAIRSYKQYDKQKIIKDYKDEIDRTNFQELMRQESIEDATKTWIECIVTLCDRHAPVKEVNIKSKTGSVPWYDENIQALKAARYKALQKQKRYGSQKCKRIVKNITNKLKNYKRKLKREYYCEKIREQSGNSGRLEYLEGGLRYRTTT